MSPTARSLAHARKHGGFASVVERFNAHARVRVDAFGFGDLLVLDGQPGPLAVQATSGTNVAHRLRKLEALPGVVAWLRAGGRVEVWGWRRLKVKRGGKAVRWTLRRVAARLDGGAVAWSEVGA